MPRGRLIFSFVIEVARLDTVTMAADPDAGGPLTSGYDPILREPIKVPANSDDRIGTSSRAELAVVQVPAQIEAEFFDKLQMLVSGGSPDQLFRCVLHFRDLERLGLVRADGVAAFNNGDRLVRILHKKDLSVVQDIPDPPGLILEQALPRGWGLSTSNARRNLLFLDFRARDRSTRG